MATTLTDDTEHGDWVEPRPISGGGQLLSRAEALWTLFGLTLLGAFLSFVATNGI